MSFAPIIPSGGLVGWRFLERTYAAQTQTFNKGAALTRDTAYFEANIGAVSSAEDLVSDRRLLRVALGAFGLGDDINSTAFVKKVLSDGTINADALANRLTDTRYKEFSKAFGFGDFATPRTKLSTIGTEITTKYRQKQFEIAVGEQDDSMRLALNAKAELSALATSSGSNDTKWYTVMGNTPLRAVMEVALGLPDGFAQIDIDTQLSEFKSRAKTQLGITSLADLADPEKLNKLVDRYLLREQVNAGTSSYSAASIALTLLAR